MFYTILDGSRVSTSGIVTNLR